MLMEISTTNKIIELKRKSVSPLYSIWIVYEEQDDNTFDVNVWDEIENERDETLEESHLETFEKAEKALNRIVKENAEITFVRLPNENN